MMKKLLLTILLLCYTISAYSATLEVDDMEYSSDALAQAAYVTNGDYASNTTLLIHFDGTDGSTADYTAETGQTVSLEGTAQLDTAQKEFGTAALLLDGNSDYATIPDSTTWDYGTSPFTIDFWVRWAADLGAGNCYFYNQYADGSNRFGINYDGDRLFLSVVSGGGDVISIRITFNPVADTWYHIAVVRVNTDNAATGWRYFVNGVAQTMTLSGGAWNATMPTLAGTVYLGQSGAGAGYVNGWIDEFRVSNGVARWTTDFTPDTIPYSKSLQSYSEPTIKTQGSYSLKVVAAATDSLNKTLTKTFAVNSNLTGVKNLRFDAYALRTGSNWKLGIHDTGGTTTEITPSIATSNTWQPVNWDLSAVADANKDNIDTLTFTVTDADSENTIYLDYAEIATCVDIFGLVN
ncbi:MAG: LamG domain-containing protein [Smithella sp.]|jgi:hypothetical protein